MSRPGIEFSYVEGPEHPACDVCGMGHPAGAVLAHLVRRPGVALFVICASCAVEVSCVTVREFWPRAPPDPPPDAPPASGGGST